VTCVFIMLYSMYVYVLCWVVHQVYMYVLCSMLGVGICIMWRPGVIAPNLTLMVCDAVPMA